MRKLYNLLLVSVGLLLSSSAFAQEAAEAVAQPTSDKGLYALASALAIAVAVFGGVFAQGKVASTALDGIARNPAASEKIFTPMILGLALIESLVLLAFVVAFVKITL